MKKILKFLLLFIFGLNAFPDFLNIRAEDFEGNCSWKLSWHRDIFKGDTTRFIRHLMHNVSSTLEFRDCRGFTPLRLAVCSGNFFYVWALILAGASFQLRSDGETILEFARSYIDKIRSSGQNQESLLRNLDVIIEYLDFVLANSNLFKDRTDRFREFIKHKGLSNDLAGLNCYIRLLLQQKNIDLAFQSPQFVNAQFARRFIEYEIEKVSMLENFNVNIVQEGQTPDLIFIPFEIRYAVTQQGVSFPQIERRGLYFEDSGDRHLSPSEDER